MHRPTSSFKPVRWRDDHRITVRYQTMKCRQKTIRVTCITMAAVLVITIAYLSGSWLRLYERCYHTEFSYPMEVGDLQTLVNQLKSKRTPEVPPINAPLINYQIRNGHKCAKEGRRIHLLIVVKSAVSNTALRTVIRVTWGSQHHSSERTILRLFLVGICSPADERKSDIAWEQEQYGDMVQGDFLDSYGNLTTKTLMGLQWVVRHCTNAIHVLFVDDHSYVSVRNLLNFLQQRSFSPFHSSEQLYAGCILSNVRPVRFRYNRQYLSLSEYPYNFLPPFVNGAYVLSFQTLENLYYGTWFTLPFFFTDVYLGIVAKKLNITLTNDNRFNDCEPRSSVVTDATSSIVVHMMTPKEIASLWEQQFSS